MLHITIKKTFKILRLRNMVPVGCDHQVLLGVTDGRVHTA